MAKVNPRRHYWHIVRAYSLLGATLKTVLDHLHPSDNEEDAAEPPHQVIVADNATVEGEQVPVGSIVIVKAPNVLADPSPTPAIPPSDLRIGVGPGSSNS